jgi:hypothetical protein
MANKLIVLILLNLSTLAFAQNQDNVDDLLEISKALEVAIKSDSKLIKDAIVTNENNLQKEDKEECYTSVKEALEIITSKYLTEDKIVSVEKSKVPVQFYFKFIAPVEDIKNTKLDRVDTNAALVDFESVIKATDGTQRDAAIKEMCSGKSMMEKIQYGSALFNMLGDVYNTGMVGGNPDPFTNSDPTKNASDTKTITIQRQYNALNEEKFGGTSFVSSGGVCRHASVAVTDFLSKCGLNMEANKNIGYSTLSSGHATVKAIDPKSGKTYFLNWGELIEGESIDPMANFEVPSESLKSSGMIIRLFDGDDTGKAAGNIRNSKGTFLARVLGIADDEIDVSTYSYNEAGARIDLGSKKITYASGKFTEASNFITAKYAKGNNINGAGIENNIFSAGAQFNHEKIKVLPNGVSLKRNLQASTSYFQEDGGLNLLNTTRDNLQSQKGYAFSVVAGGGIEKAFNTKNTSHALSASGNLVTEFYAFNTDRGTTEGSNMDGNGYAVLSVDSKNKFGKSTQVNAGYSTSLSWSPDMPYNDKKGSFYTYNSRSYASIKQDLTDTKSLTAKYSTISTIEKNYYTGTVGYQDAKKKFGVETGFTVLKHDYDNKSVYHVIKVEKDFSNKAADINFSAQAMTSLAKSTFSQSPYVSAKIIITPKIFSKR